LRHEIDTGDLIMQDRVAIAPTDDFGTLYDKLKLAGAALAARTVAAIAAGQAPSTPQPTATAGLRPAPKLTRETGQLDFRQPAAALVHLVRGLSPAPAAHTTLPDGRALKVFRAEVGAAADAASPGNWVSDGRGRLAVATADGWLDVLDIQLEGKRRLPVAEFLRGNKLML